MIFFKFQSLRCANRLMEIGEIVMDICKFYRWVLVYEGTFLIFSGQKPDSLQWCQWELLALSHSLLETRQWWLQKLLRKYVAQVPLANTCWFLEDSPQFLLGAKNSNFGQTFNNILNWWLTVHHWLLDYIHTKFGGVQLNNNGKTFMQTGGVDQ